MADPVATTKEAVKSAFKFRYLVMLLVGVIIISALADAFGVWEWVFRPFLKGKAYAIEKGWYKPATTT